MYTVGEKVVRVIAGEVEMPLKVTAITEDRVICGPWTFDKATGAEIDDDIGWGPPPKVTGSFLRRNSG